MPTKLRDIDVSKATAGSTGTLDYSQASPDAFPRPDPLYDVCHILFINPGGALLMVSWDGDTPEQYPVSPGARASVPIPPGSTSLRWTALGVPPVGSLIPTVYAFFYQAYETPPPDGDAGGQQSQPRVLTLPVPPAGRVAVNGSFTLLNDFTDIVPFSLFPPHPSGLNFTFYLYDLYFTMAPGSASAASYGYDVRLQIVETIAGVVSVTHGVVLCPQRGNWPNGIHTPPVVWAPPQSYLLQFTTAPAIDGVSIRLALTQILAGSGQGFWFVQLGWASSSAAAPTATPAIPGIGMAGTPNTF